MATIPEIEAQIGLKPNQGLVTPDILDKVLHQRSLFNSWLSAKGIPLKSSTSAVPNSVASAYSNERYLASWRSRVNPAWNRSADDAMAALDALDATETSPPQTPPPQGLSAGPKATLTMDDIKVIAQSVGQAIEPVVQAKIQFEVKHSLKQLLAETKLELSDTAKQQIKDLAINAAIAEMERRLPPQRIVIENKAKAQTKDLGLQHKNFAKLLQTAQARNHRGHRLNIWLTGPTGSGKTSACESLAEALDLPFEAESSLDADYKVMGVFNAQGSFVETAFYRRYTQGGGMVLDEIDNFHPSALLAVNSATANVWAQLPNGLHKRHPDCIIIACANTWGTGATNDYIGRSKLDAASLDRFQPKLDWPIHEDLEMVIAKAQAADLGHEWALVVQSTRAKAKAQGLKIIISPRATFTGISLLFQGFEPKSVVDMAIFAGRSPEQVRGLGQPALSQLDRALAEARSEEHTSELQSPLNLVCRL